MAKIEPGPLAASISGSVGDITFERTRFGQIVQGKPVPPVHTTPAAVLTKLRFKRAVRAYWDIWPEIRQGLSIAAETRRAAPHADWIRAFYRWQKTGFWGLSVVPRPDLVPHDVVFLKSGGQLLIVCSLSGTTPRTWASLLRFKDYKFFTREKTINANQLETPYTAWSHWDGDLPYSALLVPCLGLHSTDLGSSVMLSVT